VVFINAVTDGDVLLTHQYRLGHLELTEMLAFPWTLAPGGEEKGSWLVSAVSLP